MDDGKPTKMETFNSGVRGGVLSLMAVAFCYKFWDGTVSTDAFISIFSGVLGWWFATRGGSDTRTAVMTTNGSTVTTAGPTTVTTEPAKS